MPTPASTDWSMSSSAMRARRLRDAGPRDVGVGVGAQRVGAEAVEHAVDLLGGGDLAQVRAAQVGDVLLGAQPQPHRPTAGTSAVHSCWSTVKLPIRPRCTCSQRSSANSTRRCLPREVARSSRWPFSSAAPSSNLPCGLVTSGVVPANASWRSRARANSVWPSGMPRAYAADAGRSPGRPPRSVESREHAARPHRLRRVLYSRPAEPSRRIRSAFGPKPCSARRSASGAASTASHVVRPALVSARRAGAPMACTSFGGTSRSGAHLRVSSPSSRRSSWPRSSSRWSSSRWSSSPPPSS